MNKTASPTLHVVICVHNALHYAELCIESVLRHTKPPYDLTIVNDGSERETTEMLTRYFKRYNHIHMIHHPEAKGYTKAANAGLRASDADYTILLNSDTLVSPGWAQKIIDCGESSKQIGIIGPLSNAATYQSVPFVFDDTGHWMQNHIPGDITVAAYARAIDDVSLKTYPRVPVANGFCFAVKRPVIKAIGYLDEETFPRGYGEENDYCLRAADAGFDIAIADNAYVYHATSQSFGVKAREKLTKHAHNAIRSKYSESRLNNIDFALRHNEAMDIVRERVVEYVHHAKITSLLQPSRPSLPKAHQDLAFLFLLPDCSAKSGGTQVIVETARGLAAMGVPVTVASKTKMRDEYDNFFPTDSHLFFYYDRTNELIEEALHYDVGIATIFHSVELLKELITAHPFIIPTYYVQDYEPWFLDDHPDLKKQATDSYELIPNCELFAISPWVKEVVNEKHGLHVHKIRGCLDQQLFYPDYGRMKSEVLTISAMVRPSTAWRGPEMTMQVLRTIKKTYEDRVQITIFGCDEGQIERHELANDFEYINYGVLNRPDVAAVLRQSDIFIDLSKFQAFGRTALEAMACGVAVVAPQKGGVYDFGNDGENIMLVDTTNEFACVEVVSHLIKDKTLREKLARNGVAKGLEYSVHSSTLSFLELMYELKKIRDKIFGKPKFDEVA